jgi:hypothetical protein
MKLDRRPCAAQAKIAKGKRQKQKQKKKIKDKVLSGF